MPDARPDAPAAANEKGALGNEWAKWFAAGSMLQPLDATKGPVFAVCSAGKTNGWVFRTDRVPPVVNGKHGEIGVLVGIGTDGLIKGVHVVQQHEDQHWFSRLKDGFYRQFPGQPADGSGAKVDTVTGATVSSKAIVDDVFQSARTVLDLPAVRDAMAALPAHRVSGGTDRP